jgi:hypothetical protein
MCALQAECDEEFNRNVAKVAKIDKCIIIGDFSAQVGKDKT